MILIRELTLYTGTAIAIADGGNSRIRWLNLTTGDVTTLVLGSVNVNEAILVRFLVFDTLEEPKLSESILILGWLDVN